MDIAGRVGWFAPDRIMKLYSGVKASFGSRRLFIIGIGDDGVGCLVKCKDIAENRYKTDSSRVRFLGIGLPELLDNAEFRGSRLSEDEKLRVDPDEAIYPYLNDPETLPEGARSHFDAGLRNYTPNKPAYGLTKRQCTRAAVFHLFPEIMKTFGNAINDFAGKKAPLEIVFTGNLGDAFFGGMFIDLAFIAKALFGTADYAVTVNAYMLAGDTALLRGLDGRDLAAFYANTAVTKSELDKFQCQKREYSQMFTSQYTFKSDTPPFSSCTINAAEESVEKTIENLALKIMSGCTVVFKTDDDAERLLSHNMLVKSDKHNFRYIASGLAGEEIPLGKITSYLTLKILVNLNARLMKNSVGEMELGIIGSKVTPDEMFLALKAGELPTFEYDEAKNPIFSLKALKSGYEPSKNYVDEQTDKIAALCKEGAKLYLDEAFGNVYAMCEQARSDNEKGPYYAAEIVRKCMNELKNAIAKMKNELDDADSAVNREEKQLVSEYRYLKGPFGLFGAKSPEHYIARIKQYAEARKRKLTGGVVLEFYESLKAKFEDYYNNDLGELTGMFSAVIDYFHSLPDELSAENGFVSDAFDVSDKEILEKLAEIADGIPETTLMLAFKRSSLLSASDDPTYFAREALGITKACLDKFLSQNFDEFCETFGIEKTVARALEVCSERISVATPTEDDTPLIRVICPKGVKQGDIAGLRAVHSGLTCVWNDSALLHTVIIQRVCGGVMLDKFKDYAQWENMRYAYVNDSLKKHGIHIFT